ncbi:MAG: F0F1-type ATP synthase membrane subunit c/vacuolar-type H+-ATPase subunit K [Candidatus Paceibacteria bacterium]|jgi:F0F1-type ATP synthase membrane subunit c/vacuolar-type H+-ATPase subunit K
MFNSYFLLHRDRLFIIAAVLAVLLPGVVDGLVTAMILSVAVQALAVRPPENVSATRRIGNRAL